MCDSTVECTSSCFTFALKVLNHKPQTTNLKPQSSILKPQPSNFHLSRPLHLRSVFAFDCACTRCTHPCQPPPSTLLPLVSTFIANHLNKLVPSNSGKCALMPRLSRALHQPPSSPPPSLQRQAARAPTKFSGDWVLCLHVWDFGSRLFGFWGLGFGVCGLVFGVLGLVLEFGMEVAVWS